MYEQELAEIVEKLKRGSLTVFVGSDLPEALAGLPRRQALADALAAQEGIAPGRRLAAVAQQVMSRGSRWDFTNFLIQALEPDGVAPGPFYQKLARLVQSARPALIITTAYHRLLELALQRQDVAFNSVVRDEAIPFIDPSRTTLLKLFGDIQQVDTLVVTEQDQNALLRGRDKPDMVDEVRHAFRRTGLLFFGYDLRDPAVGTLFDEVAGNRFQARSYAVWPDLSQREMESFERNRGLTVLAMDPVSVVQTLLDESGAKASGNHKVDCAPQSQQKETRVPKTQNATSRESAVMKILFLAANPTDSTRLRLDEESRSIDQALRQAEHRDRFELEQQWAVRVGDLQGLLLRYRPHIVHFSGHGSEASAITSSEASRHLKIIDSSGHGSVASAIILEDDTGKSHPVSPRALSTVFALLKDNIRCVVLNACYSEVQAQSIAEHIDCVVGMSTAIGDRAAISFATAFYQALGYGRDIKTAFELGRAQIDLENIPEEQTPQLLATKVNPAQVVLVSPKAQGQ